MDIEEKAKYYVKEMFEARPKHFVQNIDEKTRGLHIILHYLAENDGVCAGDISKQFSISTARVAVALKTLADKGWAETSRAEDDRRKVVVKITEEGLSEVRKHEENLLNFMKLLLNGIGESDLKEFLRIFAKINALLDTVHC